MKNIKYLIFLLLIVVSAACAPKKQFKYDVETQRRQLIEEIEDTATVFNMPVDKAGAAIQRTRMFFDQYLKERYYITNDAFINRDSKGKYTYTVRKKLLDNGDTLFSVFCDRNTLNTTEVLAQRNAKNLARFIHFGTLELSLLDR